MHNVEACVLVCVHARAVQCKGKESLRHVTYNHENIQFMFLSQGFPILSTNSNTPDKSLVMAACSYVN